MKVRAAWWLLVWGYRVESESGAALCGQGVAYDTKAALVGCIMSIVMARDATHTPLPVLVPASEDPIYLM